MVRAMRAALLAIAGAVVAVAFGAPAHAEWGAYCSENYPIAPPGAICTLIWPGTGSTPGEYCFMNPYKIPSCRSEFGN